MTNSSTSSKAEASKELARRELAKRLFLRFVCYCNPWFKVSWHHEMIADALQRVEAGKLKRLMIFLPPRHSKSEMVSINFPPWVLGRNKDRNIIEASYSAELAMDFGRKARNIVDSQEYRNVFDTTLAEDSKSKSTWNTNGRGQYNALGVGGAATGKGADILIIDDPIKNRKEADSFLVRENIYNWYRSTARTRLSPDGAVILVVTRWHDDDLAGRLLNESDGEDWEVISLPAIAIKDEQHRKKGEALWPSQFSLENLLQTKGAVGTYEWSALYQQNPILSETQEFKEEMFTHITPYNLSLMRFNKFITIDPNVKEADTSDKCGVVINHVTEDGKWHIKSSGKPLDSRKLVDLIFNLWDLEKPDAMGVEETTFFQAVEPFLKEEMVKRQKYPVVYALKHHGTNKELRIRGLLPRYEAKQVVHVEGYCDSLEEEMIRFPKGKHDDELDALAYQAQIAFAPQPIPTYIEQVVEERAIDDRTGYLIPDVPLGSEGIADIRGW
jgi:hypothetical protein